MNHFTLISRITLGVICTLFSFQSLMAQCEGVFTKDRTAGSVQLLETKRQHLVVRGDREYVIELLNSERGLLGRFTSDGGEVLEQGVKLSRRRRKA